MDKREWQGHKGINTGKLTHVGCVCVAGTTVYTTRGTDSLSWMLTMMELRYPSQHLTPPKTPLGKNTQTCTCMHAYIHTYNSTRCIIWILLSYSFKIYLFLWAPYIIWHFSPSFLNVSCVQSDHICPSSLVFRSSLGEYHKDTRNLKRLKDSSEFTKLAVDLS